jgi:hypothetical protein
VNTGQIEGKSLRLPLLYFEECRKYAGIDNSRI